MIYFLYRSFDPNTAISNRMLAYLRSIERMRIPVNVVFFLPDEQRSKIDEHFDYVNTHYYWDKFYLRNASLKYISFLLYVFCFNLGLKKGDKVYIYGCNDILKYIKKKDVDIYLEITESPEVFLSGSRLYSPTLEGHLNLCKQLSALIVISNQLKQFYVGYGIPQERICVVNMIVDTKRFKNLIKEGNCENYIAYCGTVSNNKDGVDILLKSFAQVVKKHPNIKLYIIGDTPSKETSNNNMEIIQKEGIEENVVFTGRVQAEEMPQMLKNARLLALARPKNLQSQYGFPTKLGEYLLTGNPVVITKVGDIPLYLKDGENALLAEPNDVDQFAIKLDWALSHPKESSIMGEEGKKVALEFFNAFKETQKLMAIIYGK